MLRKHPRFSTLAIVAIGALLLAISVSLAQPAGPRKLPVGIIGAHMIGRVVVDSDGLCELIGYYPFIDGMTGLFAGEPGERTARFSFRTPKFRMAAIENGDIVLLRAAPLDGKPIPIRIYYDALPDRDYSRPDSFSEGTEIAVFQPRGSMLTSIQGLSFLSKGSLNLISTGTFFHEGGRHDLRELGDAATFTLSGPAIPAGASYLGVSIPFGGSVVVAEGFPGNPPSKK